MRMTRELDRALFAGFSRPVLEAMLTYPWPGNVRELKNVVERAVYRLAEPDEPIETIEFDPFESPWRPAGPNREPRQLPDPARETVDLRGWLDAQEKRLAEIALTASDGHQGKAAERLGLSYDQFRGILRKHGIVRSQKALQ